MKDNGSSRRATMLRHVTLAATTALIIGSFDGLWAARGSVYSPLLLAGLGAGTLAVTGAFVGLLQAALLFLVEPIVKRCGLRRRWQAAMSSDAKGDR
ncbi:MAG: hypothetical protein HKP50_06755, partial [Myxococcales bacterium]|nr:hypothetical protein [Myxococcales bacterium]